MHWALVAYYVSEVSHSQAVYPFFYARQQVWLGKISKLQVSRLNPDTQFCCQCQSFSFLTRKLLMIR